MYSHQPDTYIIADDATDNPGIQENSQPNSPSWVDPDLGISIKSHFKTEEDSDGTIKETLVVRPVKEYSHLTPENAYNASASRSSQIGPALSTRKNNAKKAKEYIWGGSGRQVIRLTLTLPSLETYEKYHPQGTAGVENDRACRASSMRAIKSLRKNLEQIGGQINGIFGGVEYTKESKAHVNLVMDVHHPELSDFPPMKDFLASHFRNALVSKSFIKTIEKNHPMPASIFSSTVEVQKVERQGHSFSDALNGAIEYVTKTDRHFSKGYQQNPNEDIPHNHKGCKFITDFSGLRHGVTREDLPDGVNPYDLVDQLAAVSEEEGWVGYENAPGAWVVQRTIPAETEPAETIHAQTEPAEPPAPESQTPEPETHQSCPWLYTKKVDLTKARIVHPYKKERPTTLINVKRVALQYLITGEPGCLSEPPISLTHPFTPATSVRLPQAHTEPPMAMPEGQAVLPATYSPPLLYGPGRDHMRHMRWRPPRDDTHADDDPPPPDLFPCLSTQGVMQPPSYQPLGMYPPPLCSPWSMPAPYPKGYPLCHATVR